MRKCLVCSVHASGMNIYSSGGLWGESNRLKRKEERS